MTEHEVQAKQSNIEKLFDFISQQDEQGQFAALLLIAAVAALRQE